MIFARIDGSLIRQCRVGDFSSTKWIARRHRLEGKGGERMMEKYTPEEMLGRIAREREYRRRRDAALPPPRLRFPRRRNPAPISR